MSDGVLVSGGCHCGAVRFEAHVPRQVEVQDCNCSICTKIGFLHLFVPHDRLRLLTDPAALSSYRFGSRAAEHLFCAACGIKSFYQPRSHPEAWSVNLRALNDDHGLDVRIEPFDGRNWKAARSALAHRESPLANDGEPA